MNKLPLVSSSLKFNVIRPLMMAGPPAASPVRMIVASWWWPVPRSLLMFQIGMPWMFKLPGCCGLGVPLKEAFSTLFPDGIGVAPGGTVAGVTTMLSKLDSVGTPVPKLLPTSGALMIVLPVLTIVSWPVVSVKVCWVDELVKFRIGLRFPAATAATIAASVCATVAGSFDTPATASIAACSGILPGAGAFDVTVRMLPPGSADSLA